jgi:hypothetical protein
MPIPRRRRETPTAGIVRQLRNTGGALTLPEPRRRGLQSWPFLAVLALTLGAWLGPIALFLATFEALEALERLAP